MVQKQFFKYVLPSLLAFAFSGVYAIVDGLFIGRSVGDNGLAAINLAFPITAFLLSLGTGIGMGGAVQISISIGRKDKVREKQYYFHTILLLFVSCGLTTAVLLLIANPLLSFFGAQGELLPLAQAYIKPIVFGASFQILATGLVPIVRNYNGAFIAMVSMIGGFLTNVLLDYLLIVVFSYGMTGAAVATVIGQAVTLFPCVFFLLRHAPKRLSKQISVHSIGSILAVALSPFGLTLSPNLVIVVMNKAALLYGGSEAVAVYAVISYLICIVQLLLQGVGDGCQPLISQYYGAGDQTTVKHVLKLAYLSSLIVALLSMVIFFIWRVPIVGLFGASFSVSQEVIAILPIWIWSFPLYGFLRITTSYFYAIKRNTFAYPLIYGEPIVLTLLLLFCLPLVWGLLGVWLACLVTSLILSFLAIVLLFMQKKPKDK